MYNKRTNVPNEIPGRRYSSNFTSKNNFKLMGLGFRVVSVKITLFKFYQYLLIFSGRSKQQSENFDFKIHFS